MESKDLFWNLAHLHDGLQRLDSYCGAFSTLFGVSPCGFVHLQVSVKATQAIAMKCDTCSIGTMQCLGTILVHIILAW